ncbi:MAG: WXG100 family type VII secretion target [Lachnospiraceae bacterium]|nr:WXG100 family type VII secretion target [Lachnospiraceae bacterium]
MSAAKTLTSIQIDFSKTKKQADNLESLAKQLETLAGNSLENSLVSINVSWSGESAQEYLNKGRQLEEQIKKSASSLRSIAQVIRQTAQTTYEAERLAVLLAETREN